MEKLKTKIVALTLEDLKEIVYNISGFTYTGGDDFFIIHGFYTVSGDAFEIKVNKITDDAFLFLCNKFHHFSFKTTYVTIDENTFAKKFVFDKHIGSEPKNDNLFRLNYYEKIGDITGLLNMFVPFVEKYKRD